MSTRIISVRDELHRELAGMHSPYSWQHITNHIGMFGASGLT